MNSELPRQAAQAATLDAFTLAYIEAALWSSNDNSDPETGGDPLDANYSAEDIAPETLSAIVADCAKFQASPAFQAAMADTRNICARGTGQYSVDEQAGHDFWLTRNGHGAGFWDGDWLEPHETALDALAKSFGEVDLYVGDDGKIYA
jgi:hypothetical protein